MLGERIREIRKKNQMKYNEDQTNYMPLTSDKLYVSGLTNLQEIIENTIKEHMPEV
ncbi:hypothetical protein ACFOLF_20485 [Paenibacillus sepulcri]|uniref:Transcriptional regulator n=1 Tax=Paenibacillus sepulcri TaxID=359917 RepID=A0ABS7BYK4_9BACL|nr:hypothetical protein [Paenibacillus sepulcri]